MTLGRSLETSSVDGYLRFKLSAALEKRDLKTHSMLSLTGAQRGSDGFDQIQLAGVVGEIRKLARGCSVAGG